MKRKPRVLLTNDDGFWAPGIQALARRMREVADVTIVAPQAEQSAKGHGITVNEPIRFREEREDGEPIGFSVGGTPADCVKIAIRELLPEPPDALFSGINDGRNTGTNVIYSGTVAGAMEGAFYNIPSAALSLSYDNSDVPNDYDPAAIFARGLLGMLLEIGLPHGVMLNVNFPPLPLSGVKGVEITRQSLFRLRDVFERRYDPRKLPYFWLRGERMTIEEQGAVDEVSVMDGKISITPLRADLTEERWLEQLGQVKFASLLKG